MLIVKNRWIIYWALIFLLSFKLFINYFNVLPELWMRWCVRHETIVIALSTTPYRINSLHDTLQYLYKQNAKIKAIYLSIPYTFKRDNIAYIIPEWLANDARVTILRTQDYGPATKVLGVLEQTNLCPETIIISVDDDVAYPKNLALQLAYRAKAFPNRAIGISGINMDYDADGMIAADSVDGLINIDVDGALTNALQGVTGIAYRRKFFDATVFDIVKAPRECINSDDIYLSFYLARQHIPRQMLKNRFISIKDVFPTYVGMQADALHNIHPSEAERHRVCVAYLKQRFAGVDF